MDHVPKTGSLLHSHSHTHKEGGEGDLLSCVIGSQVMKLRYGDMLANKSTERPILVLL